MGAFFYFEAQSSRVGGEYEPHSVGSAFSLGKAHVGNEKSRVDNASLGQSDATLSEFDGNGVNLVVIGLWRAWSLKVA